MPTGIRITLNGIAIGGTTYYGLVDLESVFHARGTTAAAANSGLSAAGQDLSALFAAASNGTKLEVDTALRSAGVDLRQIYAKKGTVGGGGGGGGGGGCLPFDTPVPLWTQGTRAMGEVRPGDVLIGVYVDGMIDESAPDWRTWRMPRDQVQAGALIPVTVETVMISDYPWYFLINGAQPATYEHVFMVLRGDAWQWLSADQLVPGDAFLDDRQQPVVIETIARIDAVLRTANLNVEEVDNFLFDSALGVSIVSHNTTDKN